MKSKLWMKRLVAVMLLIAMIAALSACSNRSDAAFTLSKEGIAPYALSKGEKYILQSFNMQNTSQIISFRAPKDTRILYVNVYRLDDQGKWSQIGGGGVSAMGADRKLKDQLLGTFTMQLKDKCAIGFHINASGLASYTTDEILLDVEPNMSTKVFLQEHQNIELNTEIPIALMAYDNGTSMRSYSLQDYFEPSKLAGIDLVQAVTLEFSDKEFEPGK
jgi:hypothetical protein